MRRSLFLLPLACFALLSAAPVEHGAGTSSGSIGLGSGAEDGRAFGTVVVWNHFTSGLPTGHVQGRLVDGARVLAQFALRLEDDGSVIGTAATRWGPGEVEGEWEYDDDESEFELEIELDGEDLEFEIEGEFEGRRSFWEGEWELDD